MQVGELDVRPEVEVHPIEVEDEKADENSVGNLKVILPVEGTKLDKLKAKEYVTPVLWTTELDIVMIPLIS